MKEDFEKLGLEVTVVDTTSASFLDDLQSALQAVLGRCVACGATGRSEMTIRAIDHTTYFIIYPEDMHDMHAACNGNSVWT